MKIAIPVETNKADTNICPSFGRTQYFMIYDTDTKESKFLNNNAAASQGGAGIKAAQMLIDNGTETVLTPRCGENAAGVLNNADVSMYRTKGSSVKENIDAFCEDKLELLQDIHPGFHNHGGK